MDKNIQKAVIDVIKAVQQDKVYSAAKYISEKIVVRIARKRFNNKLPAKGSNFEGVLVIGRPNFAQREFIALCKKAKEPFPVKNVQLKLIKPVKK